MVQESEIDGIFAEALQRTSEEECSDYLDAACHGNRELRRRVDRLLKAHQDAADFLESPAIDYEFPATIDPADSGERVAVIGPYKLLEQIGEGGMGVVYMAEQQEPLQRKVALKVIKPGMDSRQVIARFEAERQALAMMDHPHIAKVFDAGTTEQSQPYFVMELVKGIPITQYCDEKHLALKERLELFVPVCQAVQHAHQKGIIHRDIKPSNVLVAEYDERPTAKIIDFGVAKAIGAQLTEKTMCTALGQVVGTLEYMSPEQAKLNQLDIDTRSDIYSLGVLLYELLTGATPFDKQTLESAAFDEMLRIIREQEPPRPSLKLSSSDTLPSIAANRNIEPARLSRLVRGELDWIVMKALEKDRNRRYETSNDFAVDVLRYLRDEPVMACPPSAGYRLKKFFRRNSKALAISAVVVIALAAGAGAIGWALRNDLAWREEAARDRANRIAEIDRERTDRLVSLKQQASLLFAEAESSYQLDKLPDAFAALRRAEKLIRSADPDQDLKQSVAQWAAHLDMAATLEEIPFYQLGNFDGVGSSIAAKDRAYRDAFQRYGLDLETMDLDKAVTVINDSPIRATLLAGIDQWALTRTWGEIPRSNDLFNVSKRVDPDEMRSQIRDAIQQQDRAAMLQIAQSKEFQNESPATVVLLAKAFAPTKNGHKADDIRAAINILRPAQQLHPQNFWLNRELAFNLFLLYRIEFLPEMILEAVGFARAAVAVRPEESGAYTVLGDCCYWTPNKDEAEAAYRAALRHRPEQFYTRCNLGDILYGKRKLLEAAVQYREGIRLWPDEDFPYRKLEQILESILKSKQVDLDNPTVCCTIGSIFQTLGRCDEAFDHYQAGLRFEPEHPETHCRLGMLKEAQGLIQDAVGQYEEAVRLDPQNLAFHLELARVLTMCPATEFRNPNRALSVATASVKLSPGSADAWRLLGWAHYRMRNWNESIRSLEKSISLQTYPRGGEPRHWFILAGAHWQLGNEDQARTLYQQCERWMREASASRNEELRRLRIEFESQLSKEQVVAWASEVISTQPDAAESYVERAVLYARLREMDEAARCFDEALTIAANHKGDKAMRHLVYNSLFESESALVRVVMQKRTDDALLWSDRGRFLAHRGRWKEAAEAFELGGKSAPWFDSAAVMLLAEDMSAYKSLCADLNEQFGVAVDQVSGWQLAATCSLSPESEVDPLRLVQWAEFSTEAQRNKFRLSALASAEYRAGRYAEAIQTVKEAIDKHKAAESNVAFLMALCFHQLGRESESRDWYNIGRRDLIGITPRTAESPVAWALTHWLNANVWAREAEQTLQDKFGPLVVAKRPPH